MCVPRSVYINTLFFVNRYLLSNDVEVDLVEEEGEHLRLVCMFDLLVLLEVRQHLLPLPPILDPLDHLECKELLNSIRVGSACSHFVDDGLSANGDGFKDFIVLHEVTGFLLVLINDSRDGLATLASVLPVGVLLIVTAAYTTDVVLIMVKHLLYDNLEILLRDLVARHAHAHEVT